jgi:hypothetical protein
MFYGNNFDEICASRPVLDFSGFSFKELVGNFIKILQNKLDSRGNEYRTQFTRFQNIDSSDDENNFNERHVGENYIDPYYTKILMNGKHYNFSLCYNGISDQPGNCVIRESSHSRYFINSAGTRRISHPTEEWLAVTAGTGLEKLLLAAEVARRKVIDHFREVSDKFSDLPVWCVIAISRSLNVPCISCFAGNCRENAARNIITQYRRKYSEMTEDDIVQNVEILVDNMN